MEKEFNLSEKIYGDKPGYTLQAQLQVKDVKEFIKLLKEVGHLQHECRFKDCSCYNGEAYNSICISLKDLNKLAGDKLNGI